MESFATGLKRIFVACEEAGCKVEFEQQVYGFAVIFYRKNISNIGKNIQDNTQDSIQDNTYDERELKVLNFCHEPRNKKEIMEYLGYKTLKSVTPIIKSLLESGKLIMEIPEKLTSKNQRYITVK